MKTPRITADKLARIVVKLGFRLVRQSGSHRIYRNETGKRVTIPFHGRKTLHPKLVNQVLNDLEITPEELK